MMLDLAPLLTLALSPGANPAMPNPLVLGRSPCASYTFAKLQRAAQLPGAGFKDPKGFGIDEGGLRAPEVGVLDVLVTHACTALVRPRGREALARAVFRAREAAGHHRSGTEDGCPLAVVTTVGVTAERCDVAGSEHLR